MSLPAFSLSILFALLLLSCKTQSSVGDKGGDVDTNFVVNAAQTPFQGELLWKARWKEGKSSRMLLLSHDLDYRDGDGHDAFFCFRYSSKGAAWTQDWVYQDSIFGMGCDLGIRLLRPFCQVSDLDGDGKLDILITYVHENRCDASIADTRMVVYNGKQTGTIKGFSELHLGPSQTVMNEFLRENGQDTLIYKQISPELKGMGVKLSKKASAIWDEMLEWQEE